MRKIVTIGKEKDGVVQVAIPGQGIKDFPYQKKEYLHDGWWEIEIFYNAPTCSPKERIWWGEPTKEVMCPGGHIIIPEIEEEGIFWECKVDEETLFFDAEDLSFNILISSD